jgi:hypothetical protein
MNDPKNTLPEEEIRQYLHPTCTCLNLNNAYIFSTLHPGGGEELLRRKTLREPERKALWDEQHEVVERLRKQQQPPDRMAGVNLICEESEGRICFQIDDESLYILEEARPCF